MGTQASAIHAKGHYVGHRVGGRVGEVEGADGEDEQEEPPLFTCLSWLRVRSAKRWWIVGAP